MRSDNTIVKLSIDLNTPSKRNLPPQIRESHSPVLKEGDAFWLTDVSANWLGNIRKRTFQFCYHRQNRKVY